MKYLEGAPEQGGLKAEAEVVTTDERSSMRGERATMTSKRCERSPMGQCALDWTDLRRRASDVIDLPLLA